LSKKELYTVFLDPDGVSDNRDDLSKTIYSFLVAWLNEHINQWLCKEDFATFISLFDALGPQKMPSPPNSLDQFCINFANERLQIWIQKFLPEKHVKEYTIEGISRFVTQVPYFDNAEGFRLLQNVPGGLIHIMDDQAQRQLKKTDHTMVEALAFTVSCYNGAITYSSKGFLDRNLDAINPDFDSLFRGAVYQPFPERPFLRQGYRCQSPSLKRRNYCSSPTSSQTDESAFSSEEEHHQVYAHCQRRQRR
jgi:chitin synthase